MKLKIYKSFKDLNIKQSTNISIGIYDGCHLGHQEILYQLSEFKENDILNLVITFKTKNQRNIFSIRQKIRAMDELNIKHLILKDLDDIFCNIGHEYFYKKYLIDTLKINTLIIGNDFKFGKDRLGDIDFLSKKSHIDNWNLNIKNINYKDTKISSSNIKKLIEKGDIILANKLLGRAYLLEGICESGEKIGTKIDYPTINLEIKDQIMPENGVYFAKLFISNSINKYPNIFKIPKNTLDSVVNIGYKPTFNYLKDKKIIEVHVPGKSLGDMYGKYIGVYLFKKIRDEKKFYNISDLKDEIKKDIIKLKRFDFKLSC